eukprot:6491342-Amphidinium_carterae.3
MFKYVKPLQTDADVDAIQEQRGASTLQIHLKKPLSLLSNPSRTHRSATKRWLSHTHKQSFVRVGRGLHVS